MIAGSGVGGRERARIAPPESSGAPALPSGAATTGAEVKTAVKRYMTDVGFSFTMTEISPEILGPTPHAPGRLEAVQKGTAYRFRLARAPP